MNDLFYMDMGIGLKIARTISLIMGFAIIIGFILIVVGIIIEQIVEEIEAESGIAWEITKMFKKIYAEYFKNKEM